MHAAPQELRVHGQGGPQSAGGVGELRSAQYEVDCSSQPIAADVPQNGRPAREGVGSTEAAAHWGRVATIEGKGHEATDGQVGRAREEPVPSMGASPDIAGRPSSAMDSLAVEPSRRPAPSSFVKEPGRSNPEKPEIGTEEASVCARSPDAVKEESLPQGLPETPTGDFSSTGSMLEGGGPATPSGDSSAENGGHMPSGGHTAGAAGTAMQVEGVGEGDGAEGPRGLAEGIEASGSGELAGANRDRTAEAAVILEKQDPQPPEVNELLQASEPLFDWLPVSAFARPAVEVTPLFCRAWLLTWVGNCCVGVVQAICRQIHILRLPHQCGMYADTHSPLAKPV